MNRHENKQPDSEADLSDLYNAKPKYVTMAHITGAGKTFIIVVAVLMSMNSKGTLGKPRKARSSSFFVIANDSMPCIELQNLSPGVPMAVMSDDDMMEVMNSKGGTFIPTFMARNKEEAQEKFPTLLGLSKKFRDKVKIDKALNKPGDSVTKHDIASYLKSRHHKPERLQRRGPWWVPRYHTRYYHHKKVQVDVTTANPIDDINPYVLPEEIGIKPTYKTEHGEVTEVEFCLDRGSPADLQGDTLTLCTTCTASTHLPEDRWPRDLNQAICSPTDTQCLVVGETASGTCRQSNLSVDILCRKENYCALALQGGDTVIVNEWEPCTITIGVGCDCTVYSRSVFAGFAG